LMIKDLCAAIIGCVDADGDGDVSKEEFWEFFNRMEEISKLTRGFSEEPEMVAGLLDKEVMQTVWKNFYNKEADGLHADSLGDFLFDCIRTYGSWQKPKVVIDQKTDRRLLDNYIETLCDIVQDVVNANGDEWITYDEMLEYHKRDENLIKQVENMGIEDVLDIIQLIAVDEIWSKYDRDNSGEIKMAELYNIVHQLVKRGMGNQTDPDASAVHSLYRMILQELDKNGNQKISKEEFKGLNCIRILGGAGAKIRKIQKRVNLNKLCEWLERSNVDQIFEEFDCDGNGVLDKDKMKVFFCKIVPQLSREKSDVLNTQVVNSAASDLVGIALNNLKSDVMTKRGYKNFSVYLSNSLQFLNKNDLSLTETSLLGQSISQDLMRVLQAIVAKNRCIPEEEMRFVKRIIMSARQAKRHSKLKRTKMCDELHRQVSMNINREISNYLPQGEVAELFSSMAGDGVMSEEMQKLNSEMKDMLGSNPMATLANLSPEEAKKLEEALRKKATSKMTEMMVDSLMPEATREGIKAALGNASKGYEMAEKIRVEVEKVLGYKISLAQMQKLLKPDQLDEEMLEKVNAAIHRVIDAEFDEKREEVTRRLVIITAKRLRETDFENTHTLWAIIIGCWTGFKYRLIMIASLSAGAILLLLGTFFDLFFGLMNIITFASVEKLVLMFMISLVLTDTGIALMRGGIVGLISPGGGVGSIGWHLVETLFDSKFYAKALVRLERKYLDLEKTLAIIFGFLLRIMGDKFKTMNLLELFAEKENGDKNVEDAVGKDYQADEDTYEERDSQILIAKLSDSDGELEVEHENKEEIEMVIV